MYPLRLHIIHRLIIKVVVCSMWIGASCTMMKFSSSAVWERLINDETLTVFMAVPTIYGWAPFDFSVSLFSALLVDEAKKFSADRIRELKNRLVRYRLMVSGSAALPGKPLRFFSDRNNAGRTSFLSLERTIRASSS